MKELLIKMFSTDSTVSSSRIFAGLALLNIVIFAYVSMFTDLTIDDKFVEALKWIFGFCVGGATFSKFSNEEKKEQPK